MKKTILTIVAFVACMILRAQQPIETPDSPKVLQPDSVATLDSILTDSTAMDSIPMPKLSVCDSLMQVYASSEFDLFSMPISLPDMFFMSPIYDGYSFFTPLEIGDSVYSDNEAFRWIEDYELLAKQEKTLRQSLFFNHPELVKYNLSLLPEAPEKKKVEINPADFTITTINNIEDPTTRTFEIAEVKKRYWLHTFNASLQFSQAFVSPNWYKGGNNNVNTLSHIYYNVKLNQEYHPDLLFEITAQYKLGVNNAPDDSIHAYNVTEDVLQVNTTFGIKAANRWYYSFTGQFKTQVVNSYKSNSHDLKSAFLSPGELTAGIGMTYNYANKKKTLAFDASIAPVSYSLKTCSNTKIDPASFGIKEGRKTKHDFGSTIDMKVSWQVMRNISLRSHMFAFSDFSSLQIDWENNIICDINRYFTTQINIHARYDTLTPRQEDSSWSKLQLKEIFSIGFAYKFSSI